MEKISEQSGYTVFARENDLKVAKKITLNVTGADINTVLEKCFFDQPITYKLMDKSILVVLRNEFRPPLSWVLRGRVTNEKDEPVDGASVLIKNTSKGTATDIEGKFMIEMDKETDTVVVTAVGYVTQTIVPGTVRDIEIKLIADLRQQDLGEVVTVAFGKKRKTELVGSQTVVKPSDLKVPSSNLTSALAGRVAGIIASQQSGEPGMDNANFFVRGVSTFGYKQDPLILLDNIEITTNEFARLQTDDIASFSVMKDATSTALYGSRAANGVILITTKEGREGKIMWNARVENSWSSNTKDVELADPVTYMKLENESILTRNPLGALPYSQNKIDNTAQGLNPDVYPAVDWRKMLIKNYTTNQRANFNVNGGGKLARYYIAGSYTVDNGILNVDKRNNFNNNIKDKFYQLRSNININVTPTTMVTIRLGGLFEDYNGPIDGGAKTYRKILASNPVLFPAYYPASVAPEAKHILFGNSSLGASAGDGTPQANFINPYADMVRGYKDYSASKMSAQFEVKQKLEFVTPGLSTRFLFNTSRYSDFSITRQYNPFYYEIGSYDKLQNQYYLSEINYGTDYLDFNEDYRFRNINFMTYYELAFDYVKAIGNSSITALLVGTRRNQLFANQNTLQKSLPYRNQGISGRLPILTIPGI